MRKVGYFGLAMIFAGSVSVAVAQERPPQHVGYGTGVGDSQGVGDRSRVMDQDDMLRYLSADETIQGEVVGIDYAGGRLWLDMGGSSHDERQTLRGALNLKELYFDNKTNMANLKAIGKGDYVTIQAANETSEDQKFGTGRKLVRDVYVLKGSQLLGGADNPGFGGGFGQKPDPYASRGLTVKSGSYTGMPEGAVQPGEVKSGITSDVGMMTGAAPCWQCAPQPTTVNERTDKTVATDYGDDRKNFNKGTVQ
ncbi:hypothetical protein ACTRXD_07565 [Nitrospira sp. T9]|uniref:Organic solvent tolerance-like N-terminal domain-containing protein n=1 Tax=Candidatus Nitrospira allomarina TaxID=3020900 RepID=A0AA96GEG8_9BACT|nr:hypothetical protein [Candidatus Nitrospira allomarina]WNM59662.1 hypothetical protein PP769_07880 [Candidatus Nitrospira allomarina]